MRQQMKVDLPLLFLVTDRDRDLWLTKEKMAEIKTFADGIGPAKGIIAGKPEIVDWAHAAGLSVTIYTVQSDRPVARAVGRPTRCGSSSSRSTWTPCSRTTRTSSRASSAQLRRRR